MWEKIKLMYKKSWNPKIGIIVMNGKRYLKNHEIDKFVMKERKDLGVGIYEIKKDLYHFLGIAEEEEYTRSTGKIATGALIGGVLTGGIGLVVGGLLGSGKSNKSIYLLKMRNVKTGEEFILQVRIPDSFMGRFRKMKLYDDSVKIDNENETISLDLNKTQEQSEKQMKPTYEVTSHIPVIDEPSKREYNTPYRKSSDGDNIARINQKSPKGTPKKVAEFVLVVGISNYQKDVMKVISSSNYSFELEKEPENTYDKNAIKVLGIAENDGKEESVLVGYIPKEVAEEITNYKKLKCTVCVIYFPTSSKSVGLRLDIWSNK